MLALKDASTDSETFLHSLDALLAWVCEIEELKANQKPPSSEVKVVKAQLQEQKVCYLQHHITSPNFFVQTTSVVYLYEAVMRSGRRSNGSIQLFSVLNGVFTAEMGLQLAFCMCFLEAWEKQGRLTFQL